MTYVYSFLVGGLLCVVAQVLIDKTKITPAYILVGYVCTGVLLSAASWANLWSMDAASWV